MTLQGLKVAFLSGSYEAGSRREEVGFKSIWGAGLTVEDSPHNYTLNALEQVQRQADRICEEGGGIDILLTSEWPDMFWSTAFKKLAPVQVAQCYTSPAAPRRWLGGDRSRRAGLPHERQRPQPP